MTALDTGPSLLVRATPRLLSAVREVTLLSSVFLLYEVGRHLVRHRAGLAFADAGSVLSLERNLPIPHETWVQGLLLHSHGLTRAANVFYVSVHFPATIAFLVWMWVFRPRAYAWARSVLVSVTLVALMLHVTFPLAPPRMLAGDGFVDTMAVFGPSAYGDGTQSVTNQYAAMPSLHAGWDLLVGISIFGLVASPETVVDSTRYLADVGAPDSVIGPVRDSLANLVESSEGKAGVALVFGTLLGLAFEMPPAVVEPFLRLLDLAGSGETPDARNFIALDDGEPVASGTLVLAAGVAGIYNVGVKPDRQREGHGGAMTSALMAEGRASGAETAILWSSSAGLGCYRGLGFEERCSLQIYERR